MTTAVSRRELLAWTLALALAVTAIVATRDHAGAGVAGPTTEVVYIATGGNFPDALGAAATAAMGLGPVLLVQQTSIPTPTLNELNRLRPPRIVIMGGTAVVSSGVQTQLQGLAWSPQVTRIGGANRFETAAMLSQNSFPSTGMYPRAASDSRAASMTFIGSETVRSTTLEAPAAGVLVINGGFNITTGTPLVMSCHIQILNVGSITPGSFRQVAPSERSCETSTTVVVAAGSHEVWLRGSAGGIFDAITVAHGNLSVVWIPFDGFGAAPAP